MSLQAAFLMPHPPIILTEVGRGEEKKIQKTLDSFQQVCKIIADLKPETIIIASPHSILYGDYFHITPAGKASGDMSRFGASNVKFKVEYDTVLAKSIAKLAQVEGISAGFLGDDRKALDHGVMVPLYFINKYYKDYKLVKISLSGLPISEHYKLGMQVAQAVQKTNKNAVFIASGDLSHKCSEVGPYGYSEKGVQFDAELIKALKQGNFYRILEFSEEDREAAAECGLGSLAIMAGVFDGKDVDAQVYSYENTFGVGYGIASFMPLADNMERKLLDKYNASQKSNIEKNRKNENAYIALARLSVEHFTKYRKRVKLPDTLPNELTAQKAGVFVSLKKDGALRGCIGTISPVRKSVAEEIIYNAISACSQDPRFQSVEEWELPSITYSVDVLTAAQPITDKNELDPQKYGVIVSYGDRKGLLLPALAGVDTVGKQLSIALSKAGILEDEPYKIERFEVIRYQ